MAPITHENIEFVAHQTIPDTVVVTIGDLTSARKQIGAAMPSDQQINILLNGKPGTAMQSFARLSNSEIAAVISFTKNSFGNSVGKVTQPAEIKAARK